MKNFFYNKRKSIQNFGLLLLIVGLIMAYFYWGAEPQETIAGFLCGVGFSCFLFAIALKKSPKN